MLLVKNTISEIIMYLYSSIKLAIMKNIIQRSSLFVALIIILVMSSCYTSKPRGCGCGMEEHRSSKL